MRRWRTFAVAWVLMAVASALWALATPIGASPDEPAHLVKAASVVRGQLIGEPGDQGHVVQVPAYIAFTHAQTCYAFNGEQSADCMPELEGDPARIVDSTTTAGLYNPVYYALVGWPSLVFGDETGVYAIRIANGVLTSLFFALALAVALTLRRSAIPVIGLAFTLTPMVVFLSGTVNPNGVETTATLAVFAGMTSIALDPSRALLRPRALVVLAAAAIMANSRGLSLGWLAIAILAPLLLLSWSRLRELLRTRIVQLTIAAVAVAAAYAVFWLLSSNSLGAALASEGDDVTVPYQGSSPLIGFAMVLERTFPLAVNMIGIFGWLDTPVPVGVQFVWAAVVGALLLAAAALLRGRQLLVAGILVAAVVLLPAIYQGAYITGGGFIWQGRYTLPAFVCLVYALAVFVGDRFPALGLTATRRLLVVALGAWAVAHANSFLVALKRYVVGDDDSWIDFVTSPEWAPPFGVLPLFLAAGLVAVVSAVAFTRLAWSGDAVAAAVEAEHEKPGGEPGERAPDRRGGNA